MSKQRTVCHCCGDIVPCHANRVNRCECATVAVRTSSRATQTGPMSDDVREQEEERQALAHIIRYLGLRTDAATLNVDAARRIVSNHNFWEVEQQRLQYAENMAERRQQLVLQAQQHRFHYRRFHMPGWGPGIALPEWPLEFGPPRRLYERMPYPQQDLAEEEPPEQEPPRPQPRLLARPPVPYLVRRMVPGNPSFSDEEREFITEMLRRVPDPDDSEDSS